MKITKKASIIILIMALVISSFTGCGKKDESIPQIVLDTPGYEKWDTAIDYSDMNNWLSVPETADKSVDLVYYYPTTYSPQEGSGEVIAEIDNEGMRAGAKIKYEEQAMAFADSCNIYAPYYRQLDGNYALPLTEEQNDELFSYAVAHDAAAALDYYFEHFNNGKPFILAGHSQGSETVLYLLADYFADHPDYYERMIAAYAIGYSVTESYLEKNTHIKFAQGADDTGVVVSWNTEGPGNIGQHNAVVLDGAKSINPINWKTDDTYASADENLGSHINGEIVYGVADAQINIERGTLITNADKSFAIPMPQLFGPESYHGVDYDFYFNNIKENAKTRIEAYLANAAN